MIYKKKLKRMLSYGFGFLIIFSLIVFISWPILIIIAEDMSGRVAMILSFPFAAGVQWFLSSYYCVRMIYKVEKTAEGLKLYAIVKTYDFTPGVYPIEESLKNYIVVNGRKKFLFPKYYYMFDTTMMNRKDICYTKEELIDVFWSV